MVAVKGYVLAAVFFGNGAFVVGEICAVVGFLLFAVMVDVIGIVKRLINSALNVCVRYINPTDEIVVCGVKGAVLVKNTVLTGGGVGFVK